LQIIFDHQNILNEKHIWIEYYSILKAIDIYRIKYVDTETTIYEANEIYEKKFYVEKFYCVSISLLYNSK